MGADLAHGHIVLPMSFGQERMWFLSQLEPDTDAYNVTRALALKGRLDTGALERSLAAIVQRHEILRTAFQLRQGQPLQVIHDEGASDLRIESLADLPLAERQTVIRQQLHLEAKAPFNLACDPIIRFRLLRLSQAEHIFLLTVHHIAWDGWSSDVFFRELDALYSAFRDRRAVSLPKLPIQYGDYAVWQRDRVKGAALANLLRYWRRQLAGAPQVLELPTDRPHPAVRAHRGAVCRLELNDHLTEQVRIAAREEGVTPFMLLLAAFAVLLQRYSGQEDILVGTPISSRNRKELEPLVGLFLNTLVLRADLSGNPAARELLQRTRRACLDAYAHQDLPFEKLVEALKPERRLHTQPLFQVMFAFQNAPAAAPRIADLQCHNIDVDLGTAKFDLSLYLEERTTEIAGSLCYDADLFERATVERMCGHYLRILTVLAADRTRRVGDIGLLGDEESMRVLGSWQGGPLVADAQCIHHLFEAQVDRTPDAVAVRHRDGSLTYAEINRRANQLARYLRRHGVGPEIAVGICMERTPDMVVALLAVLKAGGAYVPLDPAYPRERVKYMIADCRVAVIVSEHRGAECVRDLPVPIVWLDSDADAMALEPSSNPAVAVDKQNLAYLIYTSGSTGWPKGVAIEHRSTAAFLRWSIEAFGQEPLRAVLASTSISFDLSIFEIFAPLCWGGSIVLVPSALDVVTDSSASYVSLINTVPSAMVEIVRMDACPTSASTINLAGEPLQRTLVENLYAQRGVQNVFNLYGPSEDTTYSTCAAIRADENGPVSIGRPVAGTQAYVLDARLEPVPIGVPGELLLGGQGLARGYLHRPDLTAEKFIPDQFAGHEGGRVYRTGDLVRWLSRGELDFLGRFDRQIKLRGFRIELGEIEEALCCHPRVRQAAAAVAELGPADRRLVTYVVCDSPKPGAEELRNFLRPSLPEHMIPSQFIDLDAMPMTPNGKIDRRALPAPLTAASDADYVAPRTPLEQAVARIWTEVLHVDRVGLNDDFFNLGGHSLLAVQVVSRVREVLKIDLPLHVLFETRRLSEFASATEQAIRAVLLDRIERMRQANATVGHGV